MSSKRGWLQWTMKLSITVEFLLEICKVYGHLAVFLYTFWRSRKTEGSATQQEIYTLLQYFQRTLYAS